jgi:hypothetical protein
MGSSYVSGEIESIVSRQIIPALSEMGLRRQREKWYLDEAGHRGFAVDVGTSHGEILIRVSDNGIQVERIPVMNPAQVEAALDVVALAVAAKKAEVEI